VRHPQRPVATTRSTKKKKKNNFEAVTLVAGAFLALPAAEPIEVPPADTG
jgi:hypothetical protein